MTNIDDMLVLTVFFGQGRENRAAAARVAIGPHLGFGAILAASAFGALGV
ncbi:hypothetical protein AB0I53_38745 [Saccharopolyspora sp. NPDC050389]